MTTKKSYKQADLDKYVEENEIELIGEYEKVNRDSRIQGKCKTEDCDGEFDRTFRQLLKTGSYCKRCSEIGKNYKKSDLDKYIEENEIELIGEYVHVNSKTIIKGKCKTEDCVGVFEKSFTSLVSGEPLCHKCVQSNRVNKNGKKSIYDNKNDLNKIVKEKNIELLKDYLKIDITNRTIINFKCLHCLNNCEKSFSTFIENSGICTYCVRALSESNSYSFIDLEIYVKKEGIILKKDYTGCNINYYTFIKGICKNIGCNEEFNKKFGIIINRTEAYCPECTEKERARKTRDKNGIYNITLLMKFINDNNIILNKEYKEDILRRETCINGKCKSDNCNNDFEQRFRYMVECQYGGYCKDCIRKMNGILSYTNDDLEIYVKNEEFILSKDYSDMKVTCVTEIHGICKTIDCDNAFKKQFKKMTEKGGPYCHYCTMDNKIPKLLNTRSINGLDKFTNNCLQAYVKDNNISLIKDYKDIDVNCQTRIEGGCVNSDCKNIVNKKFISILDHSGFVCNECTKINKAEKMNKTKLEKYGCETCKINLVYDLFTNLDCERICSDCSNPNRNPKYKKTKEWLVVRKLREDIPDIDFIHNKSVGNECTLQDREDTNGHLYPDIRFELFGFDLIVEVDEHKHRGAGYSCDERRMYDIVAKLGLPCVFIRYNPDDKKSDYNILLKMIKEYLEKDMNEIYFNEYSGLKAEYLFY